MKAFYHILIIFSLAVNVLSTTAQTVYEQTKYLHTLDTVTNNTLFVKDIHFFLANGNIQAGGIFHKQLRARLVLSYDYDKHLNLPDSLNYTAEWKIDWKDTANNLHTQFVSTPLHIKKYGTGNERTEVQWLSAASISAKLLRVKNGSGQILDTSQIHKAIQAQVIIEATEKSVLCLTVNNLQATKNLQRKWIEIRWTAQPCADFYELEWTYVDDYKSQGVGTLSPAQVSYYFPYHAMRVRTTTNFYRIPMIFGRGYVIFRVRHAVKKNKGIAYSKWSLDDNYDWHNRRAISTISSLTGMYADDYVYIGENERYQPDKNWTYEMVADESGNVHHTITYFDGLLLKKQQIDAMNTDSVSIVREWIYDEMGRIAAEVLPGVEKPQDALGYIPYYHKNLQGGKYNYQNLFSSNTTSACTTNIIPQPMNTNSGAANYYSPSNQYLNNWNAQKKVDRAIPDAQGYPFVMTTYVNEPDNRPREIGMAGKTHQPGRQHTTINYYGNPTQEELDLLLGNNAGPAGYYTKILTKDPTGQWSVVIQDLEKHTIISGLDRLADSLLSVDTTTIPLKSVLINKDSGEIVDNELLTGNMEWTYSKTLVTSGGMGQWHYELEVPSFADNCTPADCYDCVYDWYIEIKDNCGNDYLAGLSHIDTLGLTNTTIDTICDISSRTLTFDTIQQRKEGELYVTRYLRLDSMAMVAYFETWKSNNTCLLTYDDFLNNLLTQIDSNDCDVACDAIDSTLIPGLGNTDPCNATPEPLDVCEKRRVMMEADVTPYGQYAEIIRDTITGAIIGYGDSYSIFAQNNGNAYLPCIKLWSMPAVPNKPAPNFINARPYQYPNAYVNGTWYDYYMDEYGNRDTVWLATGSALSNPLLTDTLKKWLANGIYYTFPEYLTVSEFALQFKPSWAKSLLGYHPEFFYLKHCIDDVLAPENVLLGDTLNTQGFDVLLNQDPSMLLSWNNDTICSGFADTILNKDPFFSSSNGQLPLAHRWFRPYEWGTCSNLKSARMRMKERMLNYGNSGKSIFEIASAITNCPSGGSCNLYNDSVTARWVKDFYIHLKEEVIMEYLHIRVQSEKAYNGSIGPNAQSDLQLWTPQPCSTTGIPSSSRPYFDNNQISNVNSYPILKNKKKRWGRIDELMGLDSSIVNGDVSAIPDSLNRGSCRCDNAQALNDLIYQLFLDSTLTADTLTIDNCGGSIMTNGIGALIDTAFTYTSWLSHGDRQLHMQFDAASCALNGGEQVILDLYHAPPWVTFTYDSIIAIQNLRYDSILNGIRYFSMSCWMFTPDDSLILDTVIGQTCLPIEVCDQKTCSTSCAFNAIDHFIHYMNNRGDLTNNNTSINIGSAAAFEFACLLDSLCPSSTDAVTWLINGTQATLVPKCRENACNLLFSANRDWSQLPVPMQITNVGYRPCTPPQGSDSCCGQTMIWYFTDTAGGIDSLVVTISLAGGGSGSYCDHSLSLYCCRNTVPEADPLVGCVDIPPVSIPLWQEDPCINDQINNLAFNAQTLYNQYIDSVRTDFFARYKKACRKVRERLTLRWEIPGNYWTVYQYDEAGNLLQTVPPEGIDLLDSTGIQQAANYRNGTSATPVYPQHTLTTDYRYTTNNMVALQHSPDGGTTRMYYDKAFRLAASQNDRQRTDTLFSYTQYDYKGRPVESGVGKAASNTAPNKNILTGTSHPNNWLSEKREVVHTLYDIPYGNNIWQTNLRNRVSAAWRDENNDGKAEHAYVYSYDVPGNVKELRSYTRALLDYNQAWKRLRYEYDLISGKVTKVHYQPGGADQLIHRYTYDADNRLLGVWTSRDGWYWEQDAHYTYYLHGPLKRTLIGEHQVQGMDYVYTLNGWIKALNHARLDNIADAGNDALAGSLNQYVAKDILSYQLNYFHGDYKAIGLYNSENFSNFVGLYNGNIAATLISQDTLTPATFAYRYDALNRLRSRTTFANGSVTQNYSTAYTYDKMGNITTLKRWAGNNQQMDDLAYFYNNGNNQLNYVTDAVPAGVFNNDIDNQQPNNYSYDATGNLVTDDAEQLKITWTHYGKVKRINKAGNGLLQFAYDATGNRVLKHHLTDNTRQIYVRDAQGNVMAVYTMRNDSLWLDELHLYGSQRLGMIKEYLFLSKSYVISQPDGGNITLRTQYQSKYYLFGKKRYELTDWLGNVRVVINDKKTPLGTTPQNMTYAPQKLAVNTYYPFGMLAQNYNTKSYRFGFNGKEMDNTIKGLGNSYNFGARIYDSRLGRWYSPDPLEAKYPNISTYVFVADMPIIAIDPDGKRLYFVGGAGNDVDGWNYINRFKKIFTEKGIKGFTRIDASGGKAKDIAFTTSYKNFSHVGQTLVKTERGLEVRLKRRDHIQIEKAVKSIIDDLARNPLAEGEQLNLAGYSYGSVLQAHVALRLADKGIKVDNLILIGSPISDKSELYKALSSHKNIGKVIRYDIEGDKLSNPQSEKEYIEGGKQNLSDEGPHFNLARPGADTDKKIGEVADKLINEGVE